MRSCSTYMGRGGAGTEDRTRVGGLEGHRFTTKLYPQRKNEERGFASLLLLHGNRVGRSSRVKHLATTM